MRASFRLTLLKKGDIRIPSASGSLEKPFGDPPPLLDRTKGIHALIRKSDFRRVESSLKR
jgi:hypothetical protein